MKKTRTMLWCISLLSSIFANGYSFRDSTLTISGDGSVVVGQIVKGVSTAGNGEGSHLERAWIQKPALSLTVKADFGKNTRLVFTPAAEVEYTYEMNWALYDKDFASDQKAPRVNLILRRAEGVYTLGGSDAPRFPLRIGVGVFEYKYNPDVRNLGEYLFRASAYPVYFVNWYDAAFYRMTGARVSTRPVEWFNFDALLFSEMYQPPYRDFSLAGVATLKLGRVAELGGGIDLNRIFSVNERQTSPPLTDNAGFRAYSKDSVGVDSLTGQTVYSSKTYTFRSTKIAMRLSLDPKALFPRATFFGKEDLRIYGEYAILGLKNYPTRNVSYPAYYDTISQRMPFMVGFNVPAFKLLDVLSVELEYLKTPYIPGAYNPFLSGSPVPVPAAQRSLKLTELKWSICVKRTIGAFTLMCQFANDHFIPNNNNLTAQERADVMLESDNWWWSAKVGYGF